MAAPIVPVQPIQPLSTGVQAPAAPAFSYTPPSTRLVASKEEFSYRAELIKMSVEYAKAEQAYRSGLMNQWSTRKIALMGLEAQLGKALIGAEADFSMSAAVALGGRAQMIASYREKLKNMAGSKYYAPNMKAVQDYEESMGDTASSLSNTVTNSHSELDGMVAQAQKFMDPGAQEEALYTQFRSFNDHQLDMASRLNNVSTVVGQTPESQRFDTTVELHNRLAGQLHQAYDGDPRFAPLIDRYLQETNDKFVGNAKLSDEVIKQGLARHAEADKDDVFVLNEIKNAVTASGLSKGLTNTLTTMVSNAEAALGGDPAALAEMTQLIATPPELAHGREQVDRELARMDGGADPLKAARNKFIKAFNDRAGSPDAFMVWANSMGFKGRGALDRAVNFGAQNPSMVAQFADAVKTDPAVLAPTGGYQAAKTTLEDLGQPTGPVARVARMHRPPVQTPSEVQAVGGKSAVPFLETQGGPTPRIAPPVEAPAAPVQPVDPAQPRNRVEQLPDGSLVAMHPDGTQTVLVPPPAPPAPPVPADLSAKVDAAMGAPQVASLFSRPKEVSWQPGAISVAPPDISWKPGAITVAPAAAPSDIPGTAEETVDWAPTDFAAMAKKQKIDALRAGVGR